ncbi:MAG: sigma-70 family RNA polymerase sigma factor [Planctomycetia bacterium]|nr:sigma-70 family RNA polymerase sigma factor [Planctomycetia bacterium]
MSRPTVNTFGPGAGRKLRVDPPLASQLLPLVYDELRHLARRYLRKEYAGPSLQPTALVHEAYLQLAEQHRVEWRSKTHFLAVGALAMRRILVDHARRRRAQKRGGQLLRIPLESSLCLAPGENPDVLAVDDALHRLAELDPRQAQIAELRVFGGLTLEETAEQLALSKRTIEREWSMLRAWLRRELSNATRS